MPTLHWIGKEKVINHHRDVPFRTLEHKYRYPIVETHSRASLQSGNKIIHGDNLEALKALLPEYEGRIKCICIDPPYNTGNENWIYNDNVNDPKIKKWLAQVVGKEGEDLSRHDKWLCMMYPRLQLLHKLLSDDGVIFVCIDDKEQANLKLLLNEIFGENNFLAQFTWRRRASSTLAENRISTDHEYVFCYKKASFKEFKGIDKDYAAYSNPDNDPRGDWVAGDLTVGMTKDMRPNQYFDLVNPKNGKVFKPNPNRVWSYFPESMNRLIEEGRVIFPEDTKKRPMLKRFKAELRSDKNPITTWMDNIGLNTESTKLIQQMFGEKNFDYSKPLSLLKYLISQVTEQNDIILDSFAGSGTTAHAVLNLNKEDGGDRKFILIEMEDYAETITAERVKRVISGYADVAGTGGEFDYYELGEPLFVENNLNPKLPVEKIREYIYFMETKLRLPASDKKDNKYLLGVHSGVAYYFFYNPKEDTELDYAFLKTIKTKADEYIIYADNCLLTTDFLQNKRITFKKIPREIPRI